MVGNSNGTTYGKIYKNGVALGVEEATTSTLSYSADFTFAA